MVTEELLYDLADLFKVFSDSTRVRIMFLLNEGEMPVNDISQRMNMNQSAISHQLKILRQNKLIKSRREGKQIFYSLADEHVHTILEMGKEHLLED